jgi:predicted helicase
MSQLLIQHYLNDLQTLRRVSGTSRESVVREAFKTLLKDWGKLRDLIFIPEYEYQTPQKTRVYPDGALLYSLRVPLGYWEAKDEDDDLDEEIEKKFRKGYPQDNIIFEDSHKAVLIQNKQEVMRSGIEDSAQLQKLLELFFGYERLEIADFRKAVEQFKTDLPAVLKALREMIEEAENDNEKFNKASHKFLKHAQDTINPNVTAADVREMLIQHVLTEEIFSQVFDNPDFHHKNNVARELYALENTFFTGKVKHDTLAGLRPYYAAIKSAAALVNSHHEKQTFLKTIYENFYKIYNKKAADRLGVVYTPNEIVRFMVESADWLCQHHFKKSLIDRDVEILDPACGTGTFITELIEHFRGRKDDLRHKYLDELHANEVAILPYYVANLNIEATYAAIGGYEEYPNLCFVDTLDNVAGLRMHAIGKGQHYGDLFGAVSEENVARIKRQNKKKISVIIGNPPYNANQLNENENNKNRNYPLIDQRIKETYVALRDSHKTKTYDMYVRFIRWASDRIEDNGIVAFVTNRSFIDKRAFDGFRKTLASEFSDIYVIDLGGDAREGEARSEGNVFGIRVGVAISFFVRRGRSKADHVNIFEGARGSRDDQLAYLSSTRLSEINFVKRRPDADGDWAELDRGEFSKLLPLTVPKLSGKTQSSDRNAIFSLASFGCVSNRDDWVYDFDRRNLERKLQFYIRAYNEDVRKLPLNLPDDWESGLNYDIKWTRDLRRKAVQREKLRLHADNIVDALYRPFVRRSYYFDSDLNWSLYRMPSVFPEGVGKNKTIFFSDRGARAPFSALASDRVAELHLCASTDGFQSVPIYGFGAGGRVENITDWALEQFRKHYKEQHRRLITKEDIFHYVYGVLHDPIYRAKYGLNLKREFPRIPFYSNFWKWTEWGETLMSAHIGYETVEPWPLERIDAPDEKSHKMGLAPRAMLKANKDNGNIQLDSETQLTHVPPQAWTYRLGNRSALEWILEQYKEKAPKDPTVREKFNAYHFADYKEKVVDLLRRVTRVSIETMEIVEAMRAEKR